MQPGVMPPSLEAERPAWVRDALGNPTGRGVRIGVIDSGWDRTQPAPAVAPGIGLVDPGDDLALCLSDDDHDRNGHGTACTDLILRSAPDAIIQPIRVFGERLETDPIILKAAIQWAIEQRCHLVNISLGTLRADALYMLYAVCEEARRAGVLLVAATHNSHAWSYPAIFENVISVGAAPLASPFDYLYRPDEAVECLARGRNQLIRGLGGKMDVKSGTSFAAPNITGLIALFLERHPGAPLTDVRHLLAQYSR